MTNENDIERDTATHFALARGPSLCGLTLGNSTTAAPTQTTCVACLRILIANGKDAESVLRKLES